MDRRAVPAEVLLRAQRIVRTLTQHLRDLHTTLGVLIQWLGTVDTLLTEAVNAELIKPIEPDEGP